MKNLFLIPACCFLFTNISFSQSDCSNPTHIDICPSVILVGETNAGMGDGASAPCNIAGEDKVYELSAPNGARQVFVAIENATGPMTLFLEEMVCGTGMCTSESILSGNTNLTFNISNWNTITNFYLWVDAATTVTYDISFGADTGSVWINLPNLMGNLQFDSSLCMTPIFNVAKPFFHVRYNGVPQTHPMTLAPLFSPGNMCISTFFKNTTGLEGVKKFNFKFNGSGYASVTGAPSIPGSYNIGNWITTSSGLNWSYTFNDVLGIGKGDFLGIPNTCLTYEFCFTIIPVSNDPQLTNVDVDIVGDGFGAPYSGYVSTGCCPIPFINCLSGSFGPGSGSGASAFGFGFADPGGPLPIQLIEFTAKVVDYFVNLKWVTATEINNDYFTLQRSIDGHQWENIKNIDGAGNSNSEITYHYTDNHPLEGISYYRLKQTDFDGRTSNSKTVKVNFGIQENIKIYPNPAKDFITIENGSNSGIQVTLMSISGRKLHLETIIDGDKITVPLNTIPKGMYFLIIDANGILIKKEKVIVQ